MIYHSVTQEGMIYIVQVWAYWNVTEILRPGTSLDFKKQTKVP